MPRKKGHNYQLCDISTDILMPCATLCLKRSSTKNNESKCDSSNHEDANSSYKANANKRKAALVSCTRGKRRKTNDFKKLEKVSNSGGRANKNLQISRSESPKKNKQEMEHLINDSKFNHFLVEPSKILSSVVNESNKIIANDINFNITGEDIEINKTHSCLETNSVKPKMETSPSFSKPDIKELQIKNSIKSVKLLNDCSSLSSKGASFFQKQVVETNCKIESKEAEHSGFAKWAINDGVTEHLVPKSIHSCAVMERENQCNKSITESSLAFELDSNSSLSQKHCIALRDESICQGDKKILEIASSNSRRNRTSDIIHHSVDNRYTRSSISKLSFTKPEISSSSFTDNENHCSDNGVVKSNRTLEFENSTIQPKKCCKKLNKIIQKHSKKFRDSVPKNSIKDEFEFVQHSLDNGLTLLSIPELSSVEYDSLQTVYDGTDDEHPYSKSMFKNNKSLESECNKFQIEKRSKFMIEADCQDNGKLYVNAPESLIDDDYNFVKNPLGNGLTLLTITEFPLTQSGSCYSTNNVPSAACNITYNKQKSSTDVTKTSKVSESKYNELQMDKSCNQYSEDIVCPNGEKISEIISGNVITDDEYSFSHCSLGNGLTLLSINELSSDECETFTGNITDDIPITPIKDDMCNFVQHPIMDEINASSTAFSCNEKMANFPSKAFPTESREHDKVFVMNEQYGEVLYRKLENGMTLLTYTPENKFDYSCKLFSNEQSPYEEISSSTYVKSKTEDMHDYSSAENADNCVTNLVISNVCSFSDIPATDKKAENVCAKSYFQKDLLSTSTQVSVAKVIKMDDNFGNIKCLEPSCVCCQYLVTKKEFAMLSTGVISPIRSRITCQTTDAIFIVECFSCKEQFFFFSNHSTLDHCVREIIAGISSKQYREKQKECVNHFKRKIHKEDDFKIYGIDANIRSKKELEKRITHWMKTLYVQ